MTDTAILLVGGRGTRLGALTDRSPKPLLRVAGRPFIYYVFDNLISQGVARAILATGYLGAQFDDIARSGYRGLAIHTCLEATPLGTGGAIVQAFKQCDATRAFVLNGDTLFKADLRALEQLHLASSAAFSIVLRQVDDVSRYGYISCEGGRVIAMHEKGASGPGYINGGVYLIERAPLLIAAPAAAFSVERDLLPRWIARGAVAGISSNGYFIDIGVPADLARAESDFGSAQSCP